MKFSQLLNRKDSIKEKAQTAFVRASNLFDERWYASRYQDVFKKLKDPARHYYLVGWKENRNPSENFDTASYLRQYPECGICPIVFEHNRNDYADLAVCIIVKDEAPYIKEWLDYHLMVGVKRFYIYDNESFDNLKQVLLPYIRQGVVIYQYYPGEAMQLNCYRDCLKQYGDKNEWIAFIDADEFIIPMENATIPEFLADYKEYPAVGVNWVSYDSNGHKEKPKGGVMENYTRVHYDENMVPFHLIKSIVRPQEVSKVVNPHFFLYKGDKLAVNENKEEIGGDLSERAYISPFSTNKIRINHYYCKSRAEAEAKVLRGSSDRDIRRRKSISAKELNFPDYKYDYTAYKFVLQLNPEKAKIEEIKMAWLRLKNVFIEFKHSINPSPLYDYIDEKWYFEQYPDAKESGMSAAKHYVNIGWRKGYNPSKKFNTEFYLNKYKDVAKAHICPLLHYLNSGKNEGRLAYETDTVISATEPVSQPLLKHLSEWVKNLSKEKEREYNELWQNKAYFDENWYLKQYPDAKDSGMSAKKHYDTIGWLQGYNPSAKFKTNEYLKQYPECGICPIDFEYNRNRYVDLAVCAIMKNEAPYVKEWLDYHQMVGVKRFYIYDNESGDDLCQVLLPYIGKGIVVYKNYPGEAKQMPAYNEFIKEYGDKNEWVAFIDADEFIIPMEKESIPEFLADYKEYPGIGINWVAYDSNGHKAKPEGGVLENYTRVHYDENLVPFHQIKSIVQPSQVDKIINPHYALFKDNKLAVNENKQEIGGSLEERAYISPFSANKIRINHYFTKSEEEYKAKIERGRAPTKRSVKRVYNQSQVFFDDYKYDYSAYRFVTKLKPEIAQDEEVKYVWQKMKNAWIAFKHKVKHNPLYDYIDEKWYFEQYLDAKESGMSAAEHYMNIGWRKGYNPSKKFDTNFYLKKYKDVARMHVCPLLHYLNSGKKEGRLAFEGDTAIHTVQSDTVISAAEQTSQPTQDNKSSPGDAKNNNKSSLGDAIAVKGSTESVSQQIKGHTGFGLVSSPLVKSLCEWCKTLFKGKEEKYNELWNNKEYFDEDWYVANYAEAGNYKKGPKAHYRTEGWKKGYNPSPKFNTEEYLKQYPECKICPIDFEYNRNGYVDLSIVAIMRNEAPYVKEWIDYHRLVGVKRFYIYDNESEDNLKEVLTPYIEQGVVVYKYFPGEKMQMPAYNECVKDYKDKTKWLAVIDADEFVVPTEKNSIPEFLEDFEQYSGIGINWIMFDSNDHKTKPKGGLIENYTRVHYDDQFPINRHVKSIIKPDKVIGFKHPHNAEYIEGEFSVTENKVKIENLDKVHKNASTKFVSVNKIRINHYYSKSEEEYFVKINRGMADSGNKRKVVKSDICFNSTKCDYTIWKCIFCHHKDVIKNLYIWLRCYIRDIYISKYVNKKTEKTITPYFIIKDEEWYKSHRQDYELCDNSEYFNKKYYILHNPKLIFTHQDPVEHYLTIGWKEGKNPSALFDTNAYLNKYQDIKRVGVNPLIHYLRNGKKEGRRAIGVKSWWIDMFNPYAGKSQSYQLIVHSNLFNKKWYLSTYQDVKKAGKDPIDHYLNEGWKLGYNPSKEFDTNAYLERHKDVARAKLNPLAHYLSAGIKERRTIFKIKECAFIEQKPNKFDIFMCKRKDKNPLISVIVASYNYADIIGRTLDSLVAQTYKNFEVIVVDDGSKDDSIKVIKKYTTKYPFIKLHRHKQGKNMGLPATVKLGLEKAKGEYIAFCESDDYWDKTNLEEKVKIINNYANPKVIVNDVELFGDEKKCKFVQTVVDERKYRLNKTKNKLSVEEFRDKNWIVTLSCCMIKKSVIDECDITGTPRGANLDWWIYRQACCGNTIFYVNKKLTYWNMHDSYMYLEMKDVVTAMLKQKMFIENMDKMLLSSHPIVAMKLWKYIPKVDKRYTVKEGKLYCGSKLCAKQPAFSVIMPTYNREKLLESSINSLLKQTYQNFELIIVDDGSIDGTADVINSKYSKELNSGKIKYIYKENGGVCKARNVGLRNVSKEWIAYLDSDNYLDPCSLEAFVIAIVNNPHKKTFYANLIGINGKKIVGNKFDYESLLRENYIDLGVFVNHKSVYEKLGGFDENMTRLVDWDLIVRYTKVYTPYYINKTTLYYNDSQDYERITTNTKLYDNMVYFRKKNCHVPTVTTMITSYNHQDYIREAIESAIKQMGNFVHEIIISDDGSTDDTPKIIAEYAEKYPHLIRNISDGKNIGISANMKKCFEAATGKYIAVLEGDDYWIDNYKLEKQMNFLEKNKDCSMVFSKLRIFNETKGIFSYLARQSDLKPKLTGDDVIKEETLNLIGNFSCVMFRKKYLQSLPDVMFKTRLNEIAISFYMVQKGKIGFMEQPLSVYRMREDSVWTGAKMINKLKQGLTCRQMSLAVCADKYKPTLQKIIDEQYIKPLKEMEENEQQAKQAV